MYSKSINPVERPAEIEESEADAILMLPPNPPRAWLSQPRRKQTKKLEIEGGIDTSNVGYKEVVGEGNLIAAFDANGQVHDKFDDVANGGTLLGDGHEVAIEGDTVASLDAVVKVACEAVDHVVTTEANNEENKSMAADKASLDPITSIEASNEASIDPIATDEASIDPVTSIEATNEASIDPITSIEATNEAFFDPITRVEATNEASVDVGKGEDKSIADYDLFGEGSHGISLELFGDSHDFNGETSHEVNDGANNANGEASQEGNDRAVAEDKVAF